MPGSFVLTRPVCRRGDAVMIQNAVVFLDQLTTSFDPFCPWLSVDVRATVDEDGNTSSERRTTVDAVREFVAHARPAS
ncbi:hypothetical protein [Luteimicrobium subarcticum]|uniref:CdiI C-terminal domain-containing protein n=1 Tax=Luteimicrobium subarcticum TaxID=620910 RepID=A0A2M8WW83_9MICO|nr:hypothetical protein [Luteimicrobium subarcticum]PJI95186.1 hypothetical protein CLV34_1042 [Luteimicrobium subarcticum]